MPIDAPSGHEAAAARSATSVDLPPHRWPEEQWRGIVQRVRAGRSLAPSAWPGGADVAVAVSFDSDHETLTLRDAKMHPGLLSQGEYGARVAIPKILRLLARHEIPATFFVPAVSALLHPEEARGYGDHGHEVGLHGWIHEHLGALTGAEERELHLRSADALEKVCGQRPVGIRTPSWEFSTDTLSIIRELDLSYDSSLMADTEPYEIDADGHPTGVVEVPVEWIRDDAPYFTMDRAGALRPYIAPAQVGRIWREEFDQARAESGLFQLTLHPHVIGQRSRLGALAQLLDHITAQPGVWFATHAQIAQYCRDRGGM